MKIRTFLRGTLLIFKCRQLTETFFFKITTWAKENTSADRPWSGGHTLATSARQVPCFPLRQTRVPRHNHQSGLAIVPLLRPASKPMNLLMGNKCLNQPPPESHTKRTRTTNSYPPHPSCQFYSIARGEKRPILKKKKKENQQRQT